MKHTTLPRLFETLQAHLASDRTRAKWGERLIDLCRRAQALAPQTYEDKWRPYLSNIAETLPTPLATVSRKELARAVKLLPGASFELEFYDTWVDEDSLKPLAESSQLLSRVCALKISYTWVANTLIPLLTSPHATALTSVVIREGNTKPDHLRQLANSPVGAQLTRLSFSKESLHEEGLQAFLEGSFPKLTSLSLHSVGLRESEWTSLVNSKRMGQLTSLAISGNWQIKDQLAVELAQSPNAQGLTELHLNNQGLGAEGIQALSQSPYLHNLTRLSLNSNKLAGESIDALGASKAFPSLRDLSLSYNPIGAGEVAALVSGTLLTHVTSLGLSRAYVFDEGMHTLAASPRISNLERLHLAQCNIGPDGVRAIAESPHMASLTFLDLGNTNIGPAGSRALAASPHLTSLNTLRLNDALIGDEGFAALVTSPNLPNLAHLWLYGSGIGPEGIRALNRVPGESPLESLMMTGNTIGDEGATILFNEANLPNLREVTLVSADIGDAGAKALATSKTTPRLDTITLRRNNIGDEGAMAIARSPLLASKLIQLGLSGNAFAQETYMAYGRSALFANLTTFDLWHKFNNTMLRELATDPNISPWLRQRWGYILSLRES